MSLKASVGFSEGEDSYAVGANAAQDAFGKLGSPAADAVIVFSSIKYDQEKMLAGVRSVTKDALLVGASTAGEITTDGPLAKHSVAVMMISSDTIGFSSGLGEDIAKNAREAGKVAAEQVKARSGDRLKAFMMFSDALAGNGADTVRGVLDSLGQHFPVVGGSSGDDFNFKKTYQYLNDKVYSGAIVGLGLEGDFKIGIGVKHGWIPVGTPLKVTKSEGSVLHELDGKPAISIYEDYFGAEEAKNLRTETLAKLALQYPLGMKVEGSDELMLRAPFSVDANGSITCAAEVPEGTEMQLMIGSQEEAFKVAKVAAQSAIAQLEGATPKAVIIFNCIARSKLFGTRAGEEIAAIQEAVGADVPLIGFYTYSEQAPLGGEVRNLAKCNSVTHNETVVICVLAE
jgi:hypothetical protein